jgi:hypothetical protein
MTRRSNKVGSNRVDRRNYCSAGYEDAGFVMRLRQPCSRGASAAPAQCPQELDASTLTPRTATVLVRDLRSINADADSLQLIRDCEERVRDEHLSTMLPRLQTEP